MRKMIALAIVFMCFLSISACGNNASNNNNDKIQQETITTEGGMFENKVFTADLPEGWKATDDGIAVVFDRKTPNGNIVKIIYKADETSTASDIISDIANDATIEDVAFGQYIFKQFVTKKPDGSDKITLVTVSDGKSIIIEVDDIFAKDEFDLINSITVK